MLKYMKPLQPGEVPKVLLLGNGVNRAFNSVEWGRLLELMAKSCNIEYTEDEWKALKALPYPLMAVAVTKDQLKKAMKAQADEMIASGTDAEQRELLSMLGDCEFDAILTTNYTYEIEKSLCDNFNCKAFKVRNKTCKDKSSQETMYLYQFMNIERDEGTLPVWHIHGEAGKPDSMIIGHYYYGKLLSYIQSYVAETVKRRRIAEKYGKEFYPISWVDYLLFGDVYILGQGLDFSEMDLWWLLNCKKRNGCGKVVFYEPKISNEKKALAEAYNVIVESDGLENEDFKAYYREIIKKMHDEK